TTGQRAAAAARKHRTRPARISGSVTSFRQSGPRAHRLRARSGVAKVRSRAQPRATGKIGRPARTGQEDSPDPPAPRYPTHTLGTEDTGYGHRDHRPRARRADGSGSQESTRSPNPLTGNAQGLSTR